jgi:hypothetical protein
MFPRLLLLSKDRYQFFARALDPLSLSAAVGDPGNGHLAEDRDVAAVMPLGEPAGDVPVGGLGLRSEVSVALLSDEGRQQGVAQAEQLPEEFPFHGVDPLAVPGGPVHELPRTAAGP